jgi:hypothetical protein
MSDLSDPASYTPADSPMRFEDVVSSPEYLDLMSPTVATGGQAPDFRLPRLETPDATVSLSDFAGSQPVALIFGSYT